MCTLNEQGKHTVWTKSSNEWVETGDSCTFTPPLNARNFAVSAVAGGGGGGGAVKPDTTPGNGGDGAPGAVIIQW